MSICFDLIVIFAVILQGAKAKDAENASSRADQGMTLSIIDKE